MQAIAIVLLCVLSAIAYGILHDQVTARICVEYFTIGHPDLFGTTSPTFLGIAWGILATWWVGVLLGVPLAIAARAGSRPPRDVRSLLRPIGILFLVTGLAAVLAGLAGFVLASQGVVYLDGYLAERVPKERHVAFLTDAWAHLASYGFGFLGGIAVIVYTWRSRSLPPEIANPRM